MAVVESPAALRRPAVERFHCIIYSAIHVRMSYFIGDICW